MQLHSGTVTYDAQLSVMVLMNEKAVFETAPKLAALMTQFSLLLLWKQAVSENPGHNIRPDIGRSAVG
jgi:hypothetical protein